MVYLPIFILIPNLADQEIHGLHPMQEIIGLGDSSSGNRSLPLRLDNGDA